MNQQPVTLSLLNFILQRLFWQMTPWKELSMQFTHLSSQLRSENSIFERTHTYMRIYF